MIKNISIFKDFYNNSLRFIFDTSNKQIIEMTLLLGKEQMDVVCVPTHYSCNLGSKLCDLANKSSKKHMNPIESDEFIDCLIHTLTKKGIKKN